MVSQEQHRRSGFTLRTRLGRGAGGPVKARQIARTAALACLLALSVAVLGPVHSVAAEDVQLEWTAEIDGQEVGEAGSRAPLELAPHNATPATLTVRNSSDNPVVIRSIRLEGRILGLAFFVYTNRLDITLAGGDEAERRFELELADLDGQATGLIPARAILLGTDGEEIASRDFTVDVSGTLWSVYGVFGIAVAAITLVLLVAALVALAAGRLSNNRWQRATAFLAPGLGIGFILTFTLSAMSLLVPSPGAWVLFILTGGALGFAAGYLTPSPDLAATSDGGESVDPQDAERRGFWRPWTKFRGRFARP